MDILVFLSNDALDLREIVGLHAVCDALVLVLVSVTAFGKRSIVEFSTASQGPEEKLFLLLGRIYSIFEGLLRQADCSQYTA